MEETESAAESLTLDELQELLENAREEPMKLAAVGVQLLRKLSSTTRLAFIALMLLALAMWSPWFGGSVEIPSTMQTVLLGVMGALLGGKATSAWRAGRE
jgi:hypothetical protein